MQRRVPFNVPGRDVDPFNLHIFAALAEKGAGGLASAPGAGDNNVFVIDSDQVNFAKTWYYDK